MDPELEGFVTDSEFKVLDMCITLLAWASGVRAIELGDASDRIRDQCSARDSEWVTQRFIAFKATGGKTASLFRETLRHAQTIMEGPNGK